MSDSHRRFLFLSGSSRPNGNTLSLARLAARRLPETVGRRWIDLADTPLPDFTDRRHVADKSVPAPIGNEKLLLDATLDATDLVIASPLYWYSVSASVKRYLDYWSGWMRLPQVGFKRRMAGKTLWAVTVLGDREPSQADPLVETLRRSARYLDMDFGGLLLGNGSKPGEVLADSAATAAAETFFSSPPATVGLQEDSMTVSPVTS